MVRPREFDFEEVAEGLLNTFWLRGFARTSIADLTAATKLLPGSLYAAFGNKEAMFCLAVDRYQRYLRAAVPSDAQGLKGLEAFLDAAIIFCRSSMLRLQARYQKCEGWDKWYAPLLNNPSVITYKCAGESLSRENATSSNTKPH